MIMTYNYYLWQLFDIPIFLILFWEAMKSLVFENFFYQNEDSWCRSNFLLTTSAVKSSKTIG